MIRDAESDRISLINLVEDSVTQSVPLLFPSFCIFVMSSRKPTDPDAFETEVKLRIGREEIFNAPMQITFGSKMANRAIIKIIGLTVMKSGILIGEIRVAGKIVGKQSVDISLRAKVAALTQTEA